MRNRFLLIVFLLALALVLAACRSQAASLPNPRAQATIAPGQAKTSDAKLASASSQAESPELLAAAFRKGGCGACHVIPGVANASGTIGPDLSQMGETAKAVLADPAYTGSADSVDAYVKEAIAEPDAYISKDCPGGTCQKGLMPANLETP